MTRLRLVALAVLSICAILTAASADMRKPVNSMDDLPRFTYTLPMSAAKFVVADEKTFAPFALDVRKDLDAIKNGYDIQDRSMQHKILITEMYLQVLAGEDKAALDNIPKIRALNDKPDARLTDALEEEAFLKARLQASSVEGTCPANFETNFRTLVDPLPWKQVGNFMKQEKGFIEVASPAVFQGIVTQEVQPSTTSGNTISGRPAWFLIDFRDQLAVLVPCKQQILKVLEPYVKKNDVTKPEIWSAQEVTFLPSDHLSPVNVAIWDSGFDLSLFPDNLITDTKNSPDPHGLAFDVLNKPIHGNLIALTSDQQRGYPAALDDMQGFSDLTNNIDSPAADAAKKKIAAMSAQESAQYFENMNLYGGYAHGTHVTGIAARGNPFIRLGYSLMTYDLKPVPTPPTDKIQNDNALSDTQSAEWFRSHVVRVVNMSFGDTPSAVEHTLEVNGIGKDAADRKALAKHYFKIERDGLYDAIKNSPGILFVCAAGNSNADNKFEEDIPSSFVLPNLLVVGAVNQAGDETSFTTTGANVLVDADGYEVESTVPGGSHMKMSGTSMASPNVTNLAAKLLAVDPKLTPVQLIKVIRETSDTNPNDPKIHLINPKAAVARVKQGSI